VDELLSRLVAVPAEAAGGAGPGERFTASSPDWWGGHRVFGGMVVAHALSAALQTAPEGMPLHSLHGYFLRPSPPGRPVDITVERLRDGRSFALREAVSRVEGRTVFQMLCSFHATEEGDRYQLPMPDDVPGPESVARADLPIPFDVRELGPTPRRADGTYDSTRRVWVRAASPLPDDPLLHACLLAYVSDMTGAAYRPRSLGVWGTHTDASLDHAVWFHRPARADEWLLFDLHALVNAGGRSTVRGELFGQDGVLRASMAQEILIRPLPGAVPVAMPGWTAVDGPDGAVGAATDDAAARSLE
jgi:acyl-CoA thioesterase-2